MTTEERKEVLAQANRVNSEICNECPIIGKYLELLKEQESIIKTLKSDLQETLVVVASRGNIVRCKDCKHLFNAEHNDNCCDVLMEKAEWGIEITVDLDWFCADGELRDDTH